MQLKKTPFYQNHLKNNGRIIDFAGWALPVEYKSSLVEAKQARISCGMFDASHMGQISIKGAKAFDFLQELVSNDISQIVTGQLQYNLFLNRDSGIIDDCMVYRRQAGFLCVVNASNKTKVLSRLKEKISPEIEISDCSDKLALISLQGPKAKLIIEKIFPREVVLLGYMSFWQGVVGPSKIMISRSGYTGEDGFEIYIPWADAPLWWEKIEKEGKSHGLVPCGLGSRDILRIEAGYPLYGHEIDETISPYEAGLAWAVKPHRDMVIKKKRVGFIIEDKAFARQGYKIVDNQSQVGYVTSGAYSPNLGKSIGMAYVDKDHAYIGKDINIEVRGKLAKAKITKFPFILVRTISKKSREDL